MRSAVAREQLYWRVLSPAVPEGSRGRSSCSGQCYDGDAVGVRDVGGDASSSVVCDDMNGVSGRPWVSSVAHPPCIPMYTTRSRMRASSSDLWRVSCQYVVAKGDTWSNWAEQQERGANP